MKSSVKCIFLFEEEDDPKGVYVNTTSKSESDWSKELSPFYLGPCQLYWDLTAKKMENAWQYAKVYQEFDNNGEPTPEYFDWAYKGWNNPYPMRYPMGKDRTALYSWWIDKSYPYLEARKHIYIPLYCRAVIKTEGFAKLLKTYNKCLKDGKTLYLKDYDAYRHEDKGMTLADVLHNANKKCGHAFVLAMLLTQDKVLRECQLPS